MNVEGLTIREIAAILDIHPMAVKTRLKTAGIKPKTTAGKTNIYDYSAVETVREVPGRGRPKAEGLLPPEKAGRKKP